MDIKNILDINLPSKAKTQYGYHALPQVFKNNRFWKPIVALGLGVILFIIIQTVFTIGSFFALGLYEEYSLLEFFQSMTSKISPNPSIIFILFGSIAIMLPILFLTLWICRITPIGMVSSVELKIRWKYLFKSLLVSGAFTLALIVGTGFLDGSIYEFSLPENANKFSYWILVAILVLVIVPIQSAAEEYVFRGFIMQTLGGWFGSLVISIGVTSVAFAFAHMYQKWAFIGTLLFGIVCGYLVYVTGGLEASIAIHITNNVIAVMYMLFVTNEYNPTEAGDSVSALITVVQLAVISLILVKIAKKDKIKTQFVISQHIENPIVRDDLKHPYAINTSMEQTVPLEGVEENNNVLENTENI